MSITPAEIATLNANRGDVRQHTRRPVGGGAAFAELLDQAHGEHEAPGLRAAVVATAAEALRLEMLHSALALGDQEPTPGLGFARRALQEILRNVAPDGQESGAPRQSSGNAAVEPPAPPAAVPVTVAGSGEGPLAEVIRTASHRFGVDERLIRAVIKAESNFNPRAVSRAGAEGLMQLMPATARSLGVRDSFDPTQNVMAGTRFLRDLLDRYGGNVETALAAYNWGPGNVDRKGLQLPRETREYVARVKQFAAESLA